MNPFVDLQPLIELEELLDLYNGCVFGAPIALGVADAEDLFL